MTIRAKGRTRQFV